MVKSMSGMSNESSSDCDDNGQKAFLRKRAWTDEEDNRLIQLVKQHGPYKWSFIASQMGDRVGKQCRERWHNHLNPRIKKEGWTETEEWTLYLAHQLLGNKWADISKEISGRTDNSIKNHWNSTMRKKMDGYRARLLQAIHLLKTAPPKFNKKFAINEKNLIKEIVRENCLEKKQPEKKSDRPGRDELGLGPVALGGLRDFKKLTVEAFQEEDFLEDLLRMATDNELTFSQMQTVLNFIEENEEEILASSTQPDRPEHGHADHNGSPTSHGFQTPAPDIYDFHPRVPVANFDVHGDDDPTPRPLPASLLVPTFFVHPVSLTASFQPTLLAAMRPSSDPHPVTPPKPDLLQFPRMGNPENRYNIPSILKPLHDETADNTVNL